MTCPRHHIAAIGLALTVLVAPPVFITHAHAERLIASVSNHRVTITPNYAGEQLVLFGAIEKDARTPANRNAYDVVITVSGPRATMITRRKERKLGIWINTDSRRFEKVPAYLAIFTNRDISEIAQPETLRRQQIGLNNMILTQRVGPDFADVIPTDPFRAAFIRLRTEQKLYRERDNGVTFLTPNLFRTTIPLPEEVPIGTYQVDIQVLVDGALVARMETAFEIVKVGFEQFVADAARNHGFVYGLITVLFALLTGWFASVVFRRD